MSMQDLADRVGVSRGFRNKGVKVQARVESALEAPARVAPEQCAGIDREAVRERMKAHAISPERGGPAVRHQLRPPVPDHERPRHPVAGCAKEVTRGALHVDAGGASRARTTQGAGLGQGGAEGHGHQWRRRAWARGRRRDRPDWWQDARWCQGGACLPHRARRLWPGVGEPSGPAGLLHHADEVIGCGLRLDRNAAVPTTVYALVGTVASLNNH